MRPKTPRLENFTTPPPPPTTATTPSPLSPSPTTTPTTSSINQIQRQDWATDHCDEILRTENEAPVPEPQFAVKKTSQKKAEIPNIMDPPGIDNTERDKLKYEYADRKGDTHNFQSQEDHSCAPNFQSHKNQSCAPNFQSHKNQSCAPNFQSHKNQSCAPNCQSHNNQSCALNIQSHEVKTPTLDPRLLVDTAQTKQSFTRIIKDYSSNVVPNAVTKFIISNSMRPRIQYRTKESQPFHPISGNDLTPMNIQDTCPVSSYNRELYSNFVKLDTIYKRKTYNIKFGINQINNHTISGKSMVLPPVKTVIVPAQGDTGANVSATNDMSIIHDYFKYDSPAPVLVFSGDSKTDVVTLEAVGQGVMKVISDQGSVMNWSIIYTPDSSGTVLSPDHYHQSNLARYFTFYHSGNSNHEGKIGFLDHNEREIESIQMKRSHHGEWMTTNQVLVATPTNHHIVRAVNRRSERIKNQRTATNAALQQEEDDVFLNQQRSNSWTSSLNSQIIDQMHRHRHRRV